MKNFERVLMVCLCLFFAAGVAVAEDKKLKAGFIYVGDVGDFGWTNAHDAGRIYAEKKLPWLETVYIESVGEADSSRIIDRLVQQEKCDVVFTTSFGYMDDTIKAGKRYPETHFMHCSGFKQIENVGTYFADLYQMYYLNGLMAGAMSKTDKVGYVGAFPISEVVRHINAFALGVKATTPNAKVHVKGIYAWVGPEKAREAAEALVAEGCDNLACRAAMLRAVLQYRLSGKSSFARDHPDYRGDYIAGLKRNWVRNWPEGLALGNSRIVDRKPDDRQTLTRATGWTCSAMLYTSRWASTEPSWRNCWW